MLIGTTVTDEIKAKLRADTDAYLGDIIEDLITDHDTNDMQTGVDYFRNKHDILDREIYYWKDGVKVKDETATNNRVPNNYHKLLVKQKMGYLVGKPITFSDKEAENDDQGEVNSPNEEFINITNDILGEKWDDTANELVKGASNKGIEWLHIYIDGKGGFGYTIIDAREIIPIWETQKQEELQAVIRYYEIEVNGENRLRAEFWTKDDVSYYLEGKNGKYYPDPTVDENPQGHFSRVKTVGDQVLSEEASSWDMVPFIPFKNNEEMSPDLNDYKELIDVYNKVFADGANNIEDIQDVIWVLKNYQGQSLDKFQDNLRKYKAMKTDGDGGAEAVTIDIPVEAREKFLDRTEENIYKFGMGVDVSTDKYGNNPSGVALQFLYSLLDLKCDTLERKFKRAIRKLLEFIAKYMEITENEDYDSSVVKITFNKSMITNEAEKVESAKKSKGVVSDRSVVENHPYVDDPDKEMQRLEEQKQANDSFSQRLQQELNAVGNEGE